MARHEGFLLKHVLREHVLLGGLAAIVGLKFWSPAGCLVFWLCNVLIDVDHYLNLVYWSNFKALRPHQMFHYSSHIVENKANQPFLAIEPFHTLELLLLLALGARLRPHWLLPALAGLLFHMIVDVFHLLRLRALTTRCHSFAEFWFRKRRMERAGAFPTRLQREAAQVAARCCDDWRWPLI